MKLSNTQIIGITLLTAGLGWFIWKVINKRQVVQTVPPPVTQGGTLPQWQQWVAFALQVYGSVSALWQPGGPFYNQSPNDVYNSIPPAIQQQWNWNDPNSIPTGYA